MNLLFNQVIGCSANYKNLNIIFYLTNKILLIMMNDLSLKIQSTSVGIELHSQFGRNSREFDVRPVQSLPVEIHSSNSSGGRGKLVRPGSRQSGKGGGIGMGGLGTNY